MSQFWMTLKTDTPIFKDENGQTDWYWAMPEVAEILHRTAKEIDVFVTQGQIRDTTGNIVGEWRWAK